MAKYKDTFDEQTTIEITENERRVTFMCSDSVESVMVTVDVVTFLEIVKELNTLTWVVGG